MPLESFTETKRGRFVGRLGGRLETEFHDEKVVTSFRQQSTILDLLVTDAIARVVGYTVVWNPIDCILGNAIRGTIFCW